MSARAKQEHVQAIYQRYRGARRPEKQRIFHEFCEVAGPHRKHAIRLLNGPAPGAVRFDLYARGVGLLPPCYQPHPNQATSGHASLTRVLHLLAGLGRLGVPQVARGCFF